MIEVKLIGVKMPSKFYGRYDDVRKRRLFSAQLNIINRCVSHCRSCMKYTWPDDMLSLEDCKNIIDGLMMSGLETLVVSGGDPIIHPDYCEIVRYAKHKGVKVGSITTLLTNNTEVLDVCSEKLDRLFVSIDGHDVKSYKYIRGVNGFELVVKNLTDVAKRRESNGLSRPRVSCVASALNYDHLYDVYKLAVKQMKCDLNFWYAHTFDDVKITDDMLDTIVEQLMAIVKDEIVSCESHTNAISLLSSDIGMKSTESTFATHSKCYVPDLSCAINADGDVYPCCTLMQDVGEYGPQLDYAYCNVAGLDSMSVFNLLSSRFCLDYPKQCKNGLCKECGQRIKDQIAEIAEIIDGKPDVRSEVWL